MPSKATRFVGLKYDLRTCIYLGDFHSPISPSILSYFHGDNRRSRIPTFHRKNLRWLVVTLSVVGISMEPPPGWVGRDWSPAEPGVL
jgi:hypothetical protein